MADETMVLIANALSTLTILSCMFLKVPQIISIKQRKSAECISIQALCLEIVGITIMTLYNYISDYSLLTYLEYPIILLQVDIMMYYVLKYKKMLDLACVPLILMAYLTTVYLFYAGILSKTLLSFLVPFCTPISGCAKVLYIYGILKTSNSSDVSLVTWIISVLTNLSRLFTVYMDSADMSLMFNFTVSSVLSAGVLGTALAYKQKTPPVQLTFQEKLQKAHNE